MDKILENMIALGVWLENTLLASGERFEALFDHLANKID
jgi:hypothetical protein